MKRSVLGGGLVLSVLAAASAHAAVRANNLSALAMDRVLSPAIQPLTVTVPMAQPGTPIPNANTAFGRDVSPAVTWDDAPPGAQSFVLIVEDTDSHGPTPVLHWLAYNIPGDVHGLPKNIRNRNEPKAPLGMMQGINHAGGVGYIGPNPPESDPPHHYHFEVFALNRVLNIGPKASLEKVIEAMNDRVLAEGEAVATFAAPPPEPVNPKHAPTETPGA